MEVGHFVRCDLAMCERAAGDDSSSREFSRVFGPLHEKTRLRVLILKLGDRHPIFFLPLLLSSFNLIPTYPLLSSSFGSSLPLVRTLRSLSTYFPNSEKMSSIAAGFAAALNALDRSGSRKQLEALWAIIDPKLMSEVAMLLRSSHAGSSRVRNPTPTSSIAVNFPRADVRDTSISLVDPGEVAEREIIGVSSDDNNDEECE
jgi:hypothetical protein